MSDVAKREPSEGYPPEEGCYLRGNDYSPVAVCVILKWEREKTPPGVEGLVRAGAETGAALSGTLQTENIGLEKIICNVVANPNIRHMVVCGPESPGHMVGDAIMKLVANGIDERKRIIGAEAPTPYLFNVPPESVERFCKQITVIDLINEGSPDVLCEAVVACYQEKPSPFRDQLLHDPGAISEPPMCAKITWRVTRPEREPKNDEERAEAATFQDLSTRIRRAQQKRR